jgi:GGDEF domain-containing protein
MGALENALLKRALVDPATGLPNTLYLDLIREWERTRAERDGKEVRLIAVSVCGGDAASRRALALELCGTFRKSDLVASEGAERFYVLFTAQEADDADVLCERVQDVVQELNSRAPGEPPLTAELELIELPAEG